MKTIFLFLLLITGSIARSQFIAMVLHTNTPQYYKSAKPRQITKLTTLYGTVLVSTKSIQVFDRSGMLISEDKFDSSSKRIWKRTFTNDTVHKLVLLENIENWNSPSENNANQQNRYTYNENFKMVRMKMIFVSNGGGMTMEITNNEKGYPVEIDVINTKFGHKYTETATYFFNENRLETVLKSVDGKKTMRYTSTITHPSYFIQPAATNTYNDRGDLVVWTEKQFEKPSQQCEGEYTYDEQGNITEQKVYEITKKADGSKSRKLLRTVANSYIY